MDGSALLQRAADRAQELPAAELVHPFGPEVDAFTVRGKMFMFHAEHGGELIVVLKAHPDDARALCQSHADITPGYHMNKRH